MTSASASASDALVQPAKASNQRTLWRDAARRFSRNRLAMVGLVIVTFFVFLAVFADVLAPHPYDKVYFERVLLFPGEHPAHPMGTDEVGRDYLSRMIYGARTSITVGLAVMAIAVAIGVPIGGIAGYMGGFADWIVSRLVEIMTAFPGILFAILIISVWGGGITKVIHTDAAEHKFAATVSSLDDALSRLRETIRLGGRLGKADFKDLVSFTTEGEAAYQ